jgi:hypothetical protein
MIIDENVNFTIITQTGKLQCEVLRKTKTSAHNDILIKIS